MCYVTEIELRSCVCHIQPTMCWWRKRKCVKRRRRRRRDENEWKPVSISAFVLLLFIERFQAATNPLSAVSPSSLLLFPRTFVAFLKTMPCCFLHLLWFHLRPNNYLHFYGVSNKTRSVPSTHTHTIAPFDRYHHLVFLFRLWKKKLFCFFRTRVLQMPIPAIEAMTKKCKSETIKHKRILQMSNKFVKCLKFRYLFVYSSGDHCKSD